MPIPEALWSFLGPAQMAFTIWMFVDAYRRRVDQFWYWVIVLLQPIGAWAYFFAIKFPEFGGSWKGLPLFQRRVPLAELRYRAEQTPTLANHLALGQRLLEGGDPEAALPHLEAAQKLEPGHCQVLFLLAQCRAELHQPELAQPLLEKIISRDRAWSNYRAWRLLITVRQQQGKVDEALAAGRELSRLAPTLEHRCVLAEHLLEAGQNAEARELLERALDEHRYAPGPSRRRNGRWARTAQRLLKQI